MNEAMMSGSTVSSIANPAIAPLRKGGFFCIIICKHQKIEEVPSPKTDHDTIASQPNIGPPRAPNVLRGSHRISHWRIREPSQWPLSICRACWFTRGAWNSASVALITSPVQLFLDGRDRCADEKCPEGAGQSLAGRSTGFGQPYDFSHRKLANGMGSPHTLGAIR